MKTPPYTVDWYLEDRALQIHVNRRLSDEEVMAMQNKAFTFIKQASNVVDAIVDLSASKSAPHVNRALSQVKPLKHKNQGTSVIVLPMNPVRRFLCNTVMATLGLKVALCDNLDEARDVIAQLEQKRKREVRRRVKN